MSEEVSPALHIDFERVAVLRRRLEEIAAELGFKVSTFEINEDTSDWSTSLPSISISLMQWKIPK